MSELPRASRLILIADERRPAAVASGAAPRRFRLARVPATPPLPTRPGPAAGSR